MKDMALQRKTFRLWLEFFEERMNGKSIEEDKERYER